MNDLKILSGIDSIYYFCESNENYDDLYLEILDQLEEGKGKFQKKDIEFENNDLSILINDIPLSFLGISEGYNWFKDMNDTFKIGFKDKYKNRGLNDIRVQLLAFGIYTIGIKSIIEFIKDILLKDFITNNFPITRVDLNCFVQYDFSFVTKEMFVTRKRKYSTISEIGNANTTQTIYIGKAPFLLRIYNKKEELKKSKKKDLMYEYFLNNGFDSEEPIFNIEFELHRTHLKQFNILTLDDLFSNAVKLFKQSMEDIRLIDISNITEKDIENNTKNRAITLPIWDYIKENYKLDSFLQNELPLERIKRVISIYNENKFEYEYITLIRKAYINNLTLESNYLQNLYVKALETMNKTTTKKELNKELKKDYIEVEIIDEKINKKENYRLLNNGELIKPLRTETVANLSDYDLLVYIDKTREKQHLTTRDNHIYYVVHKEASRRNLVLAIEN
jgi:SOS response regulatory protein OraA/RecX